MREILPRPSPPATNNSLLDYFTANTSHTPTRKSKSMSLLVSTYKRHNFETQECCNVVPKRKWRYMELTKKPLLFIGSCGFTLYISHINTLTYLALIFFRTAFKVYSNLITAHLSFLYVKCHIKLLGCVKCFVCVQGWLKFLNIVAFLSPSGICTHLFKHKSHHR